MKFLDYLKDLEMRSFFRKYKYYILFGTVFVYMSFFDKYSFITQWKLSQTINQMEEEMNYYEEEISQTKDLMKKINSDIETFARERYYMHKDDEDVYIFTTDKK